MNPKSLRQIKHSVTLNMYYSVYYKKWQAASNDASEIRLDTHGRDNDNNISAKKKSGWPLGGIFRTNRLLEYIQTLKETGMLENEIYDSLTGRDQYEYFLLKRFGKSTMDIFQMALYQPELMTVEVKRYRRLDGEDVEGL